MADAALHRRSRCAAFLAASPAAGWARGAARRGRLRRAATSGSTGPDGAT